MSDKSTPNYDSAWESPNKDGQWAEQLRVKHHDHGERAAIGGAPQFGPNDTSAAMLKPIETRIAQLRAMLADGGGSNRANLERELVNLEQRTLPLTLIRAAEADAYHAAQPSREDKHRAELQRQKAVRARAQDIADEEEAKRQAALIAKKRGLTMG